MRHLKIAVLLVSIAALAIAPACGGSGRGFRGDANPLTLEGDTQESNVFPTLLSGQPIEYLLPIGGGCGGPYILNLIAGELPDGITLDDREANVDAPGVPPANRHHLVGIALEDGIFQGTVEVIDTGCTPFASLAFDFNWSIGQGPVQVVTATPALIPSALYALQEPQAYPDTDAIQPVIFNEFGSINLIAAGGIPPYQCTIIDDPADPDDGLLPLGTSMPPNSCSIVGRPVQVGPNGKPFKLTVRVTDSVGNTAVKKLQWKIRTPPIIIGTQVLSSGTAGQNYGDVIQIADGVPPFAFEWTQSVPSPNDNTDDTWIFVGGTTPPTIPGVTVSSTGPATDRVLTADYPAPATAGPYVNGPPSEGLRLTNIGTTSGTYTGRPRRVGTFTLNLHAYSSLVPNETGQHGWKTYTQTIVDSETAPIFPFAIDPSFTTQGTLNTGVGDTYPDLPEFSFNSIYNPDSGTHTPSGLQMLGVGGVPYDGKEDEVNSHTPDNMPINDETSDEVLGNYEWQVVSWNPLGGNNPIPTIRLFGAPAGAESIATSDGVINTDDPGALERQSRQVVEFRMLDQQLPTGTRHMADQRFGLSVGPDVVIITESTKSMTATTQTNHTAIGAHDDQLLIRKLQVIAGSPQIGPLSSASDMAATHTIPADATGLDVTNPLGSLLSRVGQPAAPAAPLRDPYSIDLLRPVLNASMWSHDAHGLNPRGGASMRHTDGNNGVGWAGDREDSYPGPQPTASALALPNTSTDNPAAGIYGDGGKLYPFENDNYFGVFVIRQSGKIYVPYAARKGTYTGFGDGMFTSRGVNQADTSDSVTRTVQITISPNGQYAAMKLKQNHLNLTESATASAIVLFSLDGQKPFAGQTYRIIASGAGGALNGVLYSTSMVLTDSHLYYLIGEDFGSTTTASWQDHFIMRAPITSGVAGEANGFGPAWTQDGLTATAMQTPFHHWSSPTSNISTFTFTPTFTQVFITVTNNDRYSYDGWNMTENSIGSIPFRVSADGSTCAVLAGTATASTSGTSVWEFHAWADRNGAGFRQASTETRKAREGGAMPHVLRRGANSYRHWGNYAGPSGGFELSNDGTRLAYTFHELSSVGSTTSPVSHNLGTVRQNLIAIQSTDNWSTGSNDGVNNVTEYDVTETTFAGTFLWKFGGLTFGKQGDTLFFWGGASRVGPSTTDSTTTGTTGAYRQWAGQMTGTYYVFDFNATTQVQSVLSIGDGGTGFNTYTTAAPFNPSTSLPTYPNIGDITPVGGFNAESQDFLYVVASNPLSTGSVLAGTPQRLIGINISGGTINGHLANRGFAVSNWPGRRGFMPNYYYQPHYAISSRFYSPGKNTMTGTQIMAKDSGYVFFATHNQYRSQSSTTSTSSTFSSPGNRSHWQDYGAYDGHVEGFHANVGGPIQRLTQPGLSDPTPGSSTSNISRTNREIHYLESDPQGSRLAYVFSTGGTNHRFDLEGVGYIRNIAFNANGTLASTFDNSIDSVLLEGTSGSESGVLSVGTGRAGSSMALDSTGNKVYYAFRSTGNENLKQLVEVVIDSADPANSTAIRIGPNRRYNVLQAGR